MSISSFKRHQLFLILIVVCSICFLAYNVVKPFPYDYETPDWAIEEGEDVEVIVSEGDSWFITIVLIVLAFAAGIILLIVSLQYGLDTPSGKAWGLMGIGLCSLSLGEATWLLIEKILEQEPFPSLADIFYLLAYPFLFIGLIIQYKVSAVTINKKEVLIAGIITAVFGVIILALLGPLIVEGAEDDIPSIVFGLAYPIADIFLIFPCILVILKFRGGEISRSWLYILFAVLVMIIADILFAYYDWNGLYADYNIIDPIFAISYLLFINGGIAMQEILSE